MQVKGYRSERTLISCLYNENRVVIHDLNIGEQKEIEIKGPLKCASSQCIVAVATKQSGLHLFSTDGVLVHVVPDSTDARCVALHPRNNNILAFGYKDGTVRMWDVSTREYVSSIKEHARQIMNVRFAPDGRLFMSSLDKTASIVALDDLFQIVSSVKLEGHTRRVSDILPLPSSTKCVTCSEDYTIKVWDCRTGACLRTLTDHTDYVNALTTSPNGQHFVSASDDQSVIIWSTETFEIKNRITFPDEVASLVHGGNGILYAGVYNHGVMSCNALTGEVGPVIIAATGNVQGLALGMPSFFVLFVTTFHFSRAIV